MSISFDQVSYDYQAGSQFAFKALDNVSFTIPDASYTAIIGHTGSGKSTLIQHLNGLLKPTGGTITINGKTITPETKNKALGDLRKQVGIVFQFPEAQLFEETVLKDIAFAPKNFGKTEQEALAIARTKAKLVGLKEETFDKSPFSLSGGQMRRVAIAGVLAMEPKILVLDEPTAGLDPKGRLEMMEMFKMLHEQEHLTIILVTHQMDDVLDYADQVLVLEGGKLLAHETPKQLFTKPDWLVQHHLGLPKTLAFIQKLQAQGMQFDQSLPHNLAQLVEVLVEKLPESRNVTHG